MSIAKKRLLKLLIFSVAGLIFLIVLGIGISVYVARDVISMSSGSCKILFADVNSSDAVIQSQAHQFLNDAVRRVRRLDQENFIDTKTYTETVRKLEEICDEHPSQNLLQIQLIYSGLKGD